MDKVYYLDLETLLEYLHGQSALLATEVSIPALREPGMGYLFFKRTVPIGCLIQTRDGSIWREGEQAFQFLRGKREWRVRLDPHIEQTFWSMKQQFGGLGQASSLPPAPGVYVPRPIIPLDPALLSRFSPRQRLILRMVFALVDGQRTVEHIKARVHIPPEAVEEALRSLYALGVIE